MSDLENKNFFMKRNWSDTLLWRSRIMKQVLKDEKAEK